MGGQGGQPRADAGDGRADWRHCGADVPAHLPGGGADPMSAVLKPDLAIQPGQDEAASILNWTPDWAIWPLAKAMRLRVVVAHDAAQQCWALTPVVDDVLLREAVSRAVARPVSWREVDEDTLAVLLAQGEQSYEARG